MLSQINPISYCICDCIKFSFLANFKLSYLDNHWTDMNDSWYSTSMSLQLKESRARSLQLSVSVIRALVAPPFLEKCRVIEKSANLAAYLAVWLTASFLQ